MSQNFDLGQQYFATQISTFHKLKIGGGVNFCHCQNSGQRNIFVLPRSAGASTY